TENKDEAKRLSPKFKGTIVLSGCFTAAGNETIPEGYDYSTFAGKVKKLLDLKGYSNYLIKGMAGPSITTDTGEKLVRPAQKAAEQDKRKETLDIKNIVTKEEREAAEKKLDLLSVQMANLEKEIDSTKAMYKDVQDLIKADPTSAEFKQLSKDVE